MSEDRRDRSHGSPLLHGRPRRPDEGLPADRTHFLEATLESSDEGLLAVDSRGRVVASNGAFLAICCVPPALADHGDEAALLEHLTSLAEDPLSCREGVMRAYAQPHGHTHEIVRLRDGRLVERRSCPLDVGESTCGRVWSFRDVTEDHLAVERQRAAERLFAEAQAAAHIGTWEYELGEDRWTWSEELYRIYGVDPDVFRPTVAGIAERCVPEDRERARASIESAVRGGTLIDAESEVVRPDGQVRRIRVRARALRDEDGSVLKLLGTVQDITARHMAEDRLRAAEERFRSAFDCAPIGSALIGLDGRLHRVNQALVEDTGLSADQLIGRRTWDLVEPEPGDEGLRRKLNDGGRIVIERRYRSVLGDERWASISASLLRDESGAPREIIARFLDITDRRRNDDRLAYEARHDPLTGLANASAFHEHVANALAAPRPQGASPGIVWLDLDRFKANNDAIGRRAGDRILVVLAHRLRAAAGEHAVVARVGDDEFAVLHAASPSETALLSFAAGIHEAMTGPVHVGERAVAQDASAGVALAGEATTAGDQLLREAESAARLAKQYGGGRVELFDGAARRKLYEDMRLKRDLRQALDREALEIVFEPIVELRTGGLAGLDAVVRWQHPDLGDLPLERVLALVEKSTLIAPLGDWFLRTVCRYIADWSARGLRVPLVSVSVSPDQLEQPGFPSRLRRLVREASIPNDVLSLKVTESELIGRPGAVTVLDDLHAAGFNVALDRFGSEGSSMTRLKGCPVHGLTIDRSFVNDLPDDPHAAAIVEGIVGMARAIGLRLVADGVATQEHAEFLRSHGCPFGQGPLFSPVLGAERVPAVLEHGLPHAIAPELDNGASITLGEAATELGVSQTTVRRLVRSGRLPEIRTAGGHRRFRRIDVSREAARMRPHPVMRTARLPERPLPATAAVMRERMTWLRDLALRAVYVGHDYGWFGTPTGLGELDRWLERLADATAAGDYARAQGVTRDVLRTARRAAAPVVECVALLDAVGQAMRAALAEAGAGSSERVELGRLFVALRRAALE